jgi:hypothetical protein
MCVYGSAMDSIENTGGSLSVKDCQVTALEAEPKLTRDTLEPRGDWCKI